MATQQAVLRPAAAHLASVLRHFPAVTYAFAYGSGAHHQPGLYDAPQSSISASGAADSGSTPLDASAEAAGASGPGPAAIGQCKGASLANPLLSVPAPAPSGASGRRSQGPVIDFIFAVPDAQGWHQQNLERNPGHYSWVGMLGANTVCGISEAVGVGVHFNTLVQLDDKTIIKYGVIESPTLERDLTTWAHLYIAGRMHKPVTPLLPAPAPLAAAQAANLHNALATALVLLPPTFTEQELLRTIVGLSYRGDVRLVVGAEDPHKVARIVDGSWDELYDMYLPLLSGSPRYTSLGVEPAGEVAGGGRGNRLWRQSRDPATLGRQLQLLPAGLLHEMASRLGFHLPLEHLVEGEPTQREVVAAAVRMGRPQRLAADSLAAMVRRSSIYQAAAGLLAAGGGKAVQYVAAKVAKAVRPLMVAKGKAPGSRSGVQ